MKANQPIVSIQYLRAAAAIAVVVFHQFQGWAHGIFDLGKYGVDLFFVISGFIMVAMTETRETSPSDFLKDRIVRIVPLYWLATLVAFILLIFGAKMVGGSSSIDVLVKSFFFIPAVNLDGGLWPILYLGWTLNYEMFFYVIFAGILLAPKQFRPFLVGAILASLVASGFFLKPDHPILKFYTDPLLIEFAAGVFLGKLFGMSLQTTSFRTQIVGTILLIAVLLLGALLFPRLVFAALAVFFLSLFLILERKGAIPKIPLGLALGNASYSIYLFQEFGFLLTYAVLAYVPKETFSAKVTALGTGAVATAVAIALGWLVYKMVELPLIGFFKSSSKARPVKEILAHE
ncbi:MAG: acyltransferase [Alphaproteobacteria bacterium PA3]|nr:MAG: acyltransferase [Alphaproteobacteria bacterium PA3]